MKMEVISKETIIDSMPDFESGTVILLDKAVRKSSFDLVYKVRKATGVKKAGHAGTLDPMATGLVIVCTGKMTKRISGFQGMDKTYTGIITLGRTTASYDAETGFVSSGDYELISENEIFQARDLFIGQVMQVPPMYSAIKRNGQALYKFARKGVEFERQPREISVTRFEITKIELPDLHFEIDCSKGTYIRVIADDLGRKLGCGAYLRELRRTRIGSFYAEKALMIDQFKEMISKYCAASSNETAEISITI
jgi:tRNA pseudouridine55 synthase